MTVLLDNTVLSNFSIIRRPDLVRAAFVEPISTTEQAFAEMLEGVALGKVPACNWDWLTRLALTTVERDQFDAFHEHLGQGEASCLALARERGYRLATDDKDARRLARQLGLSLTGTVGILAIVVKQGHVSLIEGDRFLRQMIAAGYRSPVEGLGDVLA